MLVEQKDMFDHHLVSLLKLSLKIHDRMGYRSEKPWKVCVSKFMSAYVKAQNPPGFHDMFIDFFAKHKKNISVRLFQSTEDDDITVHDDWIKNEDIHPGPGEKKKSVRLGGKKSGDWGPSDLKCQGYVIYFDNKNPKHATYSIPISEIYVCATKLYKKERERDPATGKFPASVLLHIYSIFLEVAPCDKKLFQQNIDDITEFLENISSSEEPSDGVGSGFNSLTDMFQRVVKATGIGQEGGTADENGIKKIIDNVLESKTLENVGKVVEEVTKSFTTANSKNSSGFSGVLNSLGQALQSGGVHEAVEETAKCINIPGVQMPTAESEAAGEQE